MPEPAGTGTEDELEEGRETNTYPMITLSVDSETEAETKEQGDSTTSTANQKD